MISLSGVLASVEKVADDFVATVKADLATVPDEATAIANFKTYVTEELQKIAPIATIETEINGVIFPLLRPVATAVEGKIIPELELDLVNLIVALGQKVIVTKFGQNWFTDLKAAI